MINRRRFLALGAATVAGSTLARAAGAQGSANTMSGPMSEDAYRPLKLPPKPNAAPSMTNAERDDLEHRLKCQCGTCVLDVFTCRTTDFSCPVSPSMHVDAMSLVAGGYTGVEILAAFRSVYGERVLMAPVKEGFNLVGYALPFAALAIGGTGLFALLRRWTNRPVAPAATVVQTDATPEELSEITRAMRDDE